MRNDLNFRKTTDPAPDRRWYRPHCRRCGRQVSVARSLAGAGLELCAGCSSADRARYGGPLSYNFSPFRAVAARA